MSTAPKCKLCQVRHWNTEPHHLKQTAPPRAVSIVPAVLGTQLVLFDAARRAVEEARTVDEVKDVRDRAAAIRLYMRQAGESREMQVGIAEIQLRAERRIGEMLTDIEKHAGGHPLTGSPGEQVRPATLKQLGVSRKQSFRWQAEATVPEAEFERYVDEEKAKGRAATSAGLYRLARPSVSASPPADLCCPQCGYSGPPGQFRPSL